ncbi:MAG: VWA domain-containing protein [Alphaproteobacteria bacterium]|nr:VWA domain-containing protein [Alphaproteobacteria bacterium]
MLRSYRFLCGYAAALIFALGVSLAGGPATAAGLLAPADGSRANIEIKTHNVTVIIENSFAITTIDQVFHNPHPQALETVYSFPVPEDAAVAEFTYWIDGQPVIGEVLPKEKARQVYETEQQAQREAGLVEQKDYRTFDIAVSQVPAGQDVRTRLVYIQAMPVDTGVGRYVYPLEEGGVDEDRKAFWLLNDQVATEFTFDLRLRSGYPVSDMRLPDHPNALVSRHSEQEWSVRIAPNQSAEDDGPIQPAGIRYPGTAARLDTDIVTYWRLESGLPAGINLVANKAPGDKRGTFMLVVTPGDDLPPISRGRDWVFVLDKSGSMQTKFHTLAEGVAEAVSKMPPDDRFRIFLFDRTASEMTSGFVAASSTEARTALDLLRAVQPDNGTNLYGGLDLGLRAVDADRTSGIVLVTDGVANVGEVRQRAFVDRVRQQDTRLFTVIMGNSANRPLLEAMTGASGGSAVSVSNSDDVVGVVMEALSRLGHEAMTDVELSIEGVRTADVTPSAPGNLYRGQQLSLFGHYWNGGPAEVILKGRIGGEDRVYRARFAFPGEATLNPEIERLWAFSQVDRLLTENDHFGETGDRAQAITDLAIEYGLLTPYTSIIALRPEMYAQYGIERKQGVRRSIEEQAQLRRLSEKIANNRADENSPMFQTARAGHGTGTGSLGLVGFLVAAVAAIAALGVGRRAAGKSTP